MESLLNVLNFNLSLAADFIITGFVFIISLLSSFIFVKFNQVLLYILSYFFIVFCLVFIVFSCLSCDISYIFVRHDSVVFVLGSQSETAVLDDVTFPRVGSL